MQQGKFFTAIVLCAGKSTRMGYNKMLLKIGNKTVFERTMDAFENCESIDEIIIAAPGEDMESYGEMVKENGYAKVTNIVQGGATRQESVANALMAISDECEYIAVHDGARPLIKEESITLVAQSAIEHGGAVAAVKSVDTLKAVDETGIITGTVDRERTVQVRTPQIFEREILLAAHKKAKEDNFEGTDECMLVERLNKKIQTVITGRDNVKITYPDDVIYMTNVLRARGML